MRLRALLPLLVAAFAPMTARAACSPTPATAPLTVNFLGVSTIVLRGGNEAIMVDGFFSRPDLRQTAFHDLAIDGPRIVESLERARLRRLNAAERPGDARLLALLVAQAHHDHSMDAVRVAQETGARILGSPSTGNIVAGALEPPQFDSFDALPEECFGPFRVRSIRSPHAPGLIPLLVYGSIRSPMRGSAHALAYRDKRNYSFLITYGEQRILIHPSASHPRRGMGNIRADIVFLSLGDLGARSPRYIEDYWTAVARRSEARIVVPIHWDNFFAAVRPPDVPDSLETEKRWRNGLPIPLFRRQFAYALRKIEEHARRDCVQVRFLEAFEESRLEQLIVDADAYREWCLNEQAAGNAR